MADASHFPHGVKSFLEEYLFCPTLFPVRFPQLAAQFYFPHISEDQEIIIGRSN